MAYQKQSWRNLPDRTTPITAARLEHMETQYDEAVLNSKAYTDQEINKIEIGIEAGTGRVNVIDFGADPTGVEDSSSAVQEALDGVSGSGGTVVFPPGRYLVRGVVYMSSNTIVEGVGATLLKDQPSASPLFAALAEGGVKENIVIRDLIFEGDLPLRGVNAFWGHKTRNVLISNIVINGCITNGHGVDLQGCQGVVIENSVFRGSSAEESRGFTEAIQLDYSVRSGAPAPAPNEVFDGTPTSDVVVQGCRFEGWNGFRAPRGVGSHSAVQGKQISDITIRDNYFEKPNIRTTGYLRGVLNFIAVENITITGNRFNLEGDTNAPQIIKFHDAHEWTPISEVDNPGSSVPTTESLKGFVMNVYGNTTDTFSIPFVEGERTEIPISNPTNFAYYSANTVLEAYFSGSDVVVTGAISCKTAGYVTGTSKRVFAVLPDVFKPRTPSGWIMIASGTERWALEVGSDGNLSASRYSGTQNAGAWMNVDIYLKSR